MDGRSAIERIAMRVQSDIPFRAIAVAMVAAVCVLAGCAAPRTPRASDWLPHERPGSPPSVAVVVVPAVAKEGAEGVSAKVAAAGVVGSAATVAATAPVALVAGTTALLGPLALVGAGVAIVGSTFAHLASASLQRSAAELDAATQVESVGDSLAPTIPKDIAATLTSITGAPADVVAHREGHDATSLRGAGYGSALELGAIGLRFAAIARSTTEERVYALVYTMQARLVDTSDGRIVGMRGLVVASPMRAASDWTRDGGTLLRRDAERAGRRLAEAAVEALVLQVDLDAPGSSAACGVDLLSPRSTWSFLDGWNVAETQSLTPTLAWGARRAASNGTQQPGGARDFRYDVRVWRIVEGEVGRLVAERIGIEGTEWALAEPLEPDATYGWSVRARYAIDGRTRGDRWSAIPVPVGGEAWWYAWSTWTTDASGTVKPAPCPHDRYRQACGCCDYLPAAALRKFRTPGALP